MKTLVSLATAWLALAIIVGVAGSDWFRREQGQREINLFRRDLQAIRQWVESTAWPRPLPTLESHSAWTATQDIFSVSMIVRESAKAARESAKAARESAKAAREVASESASAGDSASDASEAARFDSPPATTQRETGPGEDMTTATDVPVTDVRHEISAVGRGRLSATLPNVRIGESRIDLLVVRDLSSGSLQATWWSLWGLLNLGGFVFAVGCLQYLQSRRLVQRRVILPWLDAVRLEKRNPIRLLPAVGDPESALAGPLEIVAEEVNRLVRQLREANQRSDLVLGNLQEGVLAIDDRSQVLLANNALRGHLELPHEPYLNRPLLEVVRVPIVAELCHQVLSQHVPLEDCCELGHPPRSLRLLARPLPLESDPEGRERVGALITVRDETLLRRIEAVRRDFVANASHELKTPLAAIRAYAETLQMGAIEDRETAEKFIQNIITQADRINHLVQGMLQLSRVQAGGMLRKESFDVGEALESCLAATEAVANAKSIRIERHLPASPLVVQSDREGLQTIISNLLSNAVRYTPAGGHVRLTVQQIDEQLILSVADTGIGIHPDELERIFERFYRTEKARSPSTGGTGLGLAIVRNLVQVLGGQVTVESQPQAGSEFRVYLPLDH